MYADGYVPVIFTWEMTRAYSDINTNGGPRLMSPYRARYFRANVMVT